MIKKQTNVGTGNHVNTGVLHGYLELFTVEHLSGSALPESYTLPNNRSTSAERTVRTIAFARFTTNPPPTRPSFDSESCYAAGCPAISI
ncbi:hypothetical protein J6590_087408 [Homalodisca vitripennis]|nr:hypothetical protein J6590_087408 [Homalodisca vitripennis]